MKKTLLMLGALCLLAIGTPSFAACPCADPCCPVIAPCAPACPVVSPCVTPAPCYAQPTGFACPCNPCYDNCNRCNDGCREKCSWWKFWQNKNCCDKCDNCCD